MGSFGWFTRLKYALVAAVAGWLAGWAASLPFEVALAWRYVDADWRALPLALAKGTLVWGAFDLFMASAGFVPLALPVLLLVSPAWIVKWRRLLIPAAGFIAMLAIYRRMGLLSGYHFRHPEDILSFFFTAPNFFVIAFAVVLVWAYAGQARRRLVAPSLVGSHLG